MSERVVIRPAYVVACSRCTRHVMLAIDEGLTVTAELSGLSINGEIAALLSGLATYDVIRNPGRKSVYLYWRHIFRMRGNREYPVVAEHKCPDGGKPVMTWRIPEKPITAAARPAPVNDKTPAPF